MSDARADAARYAAQRAAGEVPQTGAADEPAGLNAQNMPAIVETAIQQAIRRVIEARRQLQGGPPVVTPTRDVDAEVAAWRARRDARRTAEPHPEQPSAAPRPRRRWFRR